MNPGSFQLVTDNFLVTIPIKVFFCNNYTWTSIGAGESNKNYIVGKYSHLRYHKFFLSFFYPLP